MHLHVPPMIGTQAYLRVCLRVSRVPLVGSVSPAPTRVKFVRQGAFLPVRAWQLVRRVPRGSMRRPRVLAVVTCLFKICVLKILN
jgi:hypothetical protein